MTDRQFSAWQDWLVEEYNRPSRVEQVLTVIAKVAHGIDVEWKIPQETVKDPNKSDLPNVLGALSCIVRGNIKGGDKLAARIQQLEAEGKL